MYKKFGQFIDGKWSPSSNKETYEVINPATEEVLGQASKAAPADVDRALKSAEKGLAVWRKTPAWQRSYILRKIADRMREKKDISREELLSMMAGGEELDKLEVELKEMGRLNS